MIEVVNVNMLINHLWVKHEKDFGWWMFSVHIICILAFLLNYYFDIKHPKELTHWWFPMCL
jgi:hypothetical protein